MQFSGDYAYLYLENVMQTRVNIACENIRFSSLFAAGDVSQGGTNVNTKNL